MLQISQRHPSESRLVLGIDMWVMSRHCVSCSSSTLSQWHGRLGNLSAPGLSDPLHCPHGCDRHRCAFICPCRVEHQAEWARRADRSRPNRSCREDLPGRDLSCYSRVSRAKSRRRVYTETPGAMRFDFTMCNPPFYASETEVLESHAGKNEAPFAVRFPLYMACMMGC